MLRRLFFELYFIHCPVLYDTCHHLQHETNEKERQELRRGGLSRGTGSWAYLFIPGGHGALHVLVAGKEGHDAVGDHGGHLQQEVPIVPDHGWVGGGGGERMCTGPAPPPLSKVS